MSSALAVPPITPEPSIVKSRRRSVGKATGAAVRHGSERVKVSFYLSVDTDRRLSVHAAMTDKDRSQVVEEALRSILKEWIVVHRGQREATEDSSAA